MDTLLIVLPVFAIMAAGWGFARRGLITDAGVAGIVNVMFYLAIPALLFRTLASGAVQERLEVTILFAYFAAALLQFVLGWTISRKLFRNAGDVSGLAGMGATFSNMVLIGVPLMQRAYGDAGLVPLMLLITVHSAILFTVTTLAVEMGRGSVGGRVGTALRGLRSVFLNPIVIAALGGLGFGFTGLELPAVVDDTLALLGRGAAPLSLFAVGATLSAYRIAGDLRESLVFVALKLAVLPLLVWASCTYVFGLRADWTTVAVVAAALPTGANVYVFARKFDVWVARGTAVVLLSTVVSIVTLSALIAVLPAP